MNSTAMLRKMIGGLRCLDWSGNTNTRDTRYGMRDTRYGLRDVGYGMLDIGCGMRDAGYGIRDMRRASEL